MVIKFNGDPVDDANPDSVLAHINKQVVWYSPKYDITKTILDRLNQRSLAPAAANSQARPGVGVPYQR